MHFKQQLKLATHFYNLYLSGTTNKPYAPIVAFRACLESPNEAQVLAKKLAKCI